MVLDRDNTGTGNESMRITVTDGANTILYQLDFTNTLGSYAAGLLNTTAYTTAPALNPITFTTLSLAGNNLPEEVSVQEIGSCDTLDWAAPDATAPSSASPQQVVTVTGSGCPEGPVTAELHAEAGDGIALSTGVDDGVSGLDDPFSIGLPITIDTPPGPAVIEVFCGASEDPVSEVTVLDITIVAAPPPSSTSTTPAPTTVAQSGTVAPRFTG
jgi:hypothetical protein